MGEYDGDVDSVSLVPENNAIPAGVVLAIGSLVGLYFAWNMETAVSVYGGATHNLGLLQNRELAVNAALTAFLAGIVLFAAGLIINEFQSKRHVKSGE